MHYLVEVQKALRINPDRLGIEFPNLAKSTYRKTKSMSKHLASTLVYNPINLIT